MNPPSESEKAGTDLPLLELRDLRVRFPQDWRWSGSVRSWREVVAGANLCLAPGETLALVGESGCGKSTLARALVGLVPASGGRALWRPRRPGTPPPVDLLSLQERSWRRYRPGLSLVFQDTGSALDPRMKVGDSVSEGLRIHRRLGRRRAWKRAEALLEMVGLSATDANRRPAAFSGGQRQRIGIARGLALDPELMICDEIVSALDVLVQARILDLLKRLQGERGMALLFITHDLALARQFAPRTAVMDGGRIVECGNSEDLFQNPRHPRTRALVAAVPLL